MGVFIKFTIQTLIAQLSERFTNHHRVYLSPESMCLIVNWRIFRWKKKGLVCDRGGSMVKPQSSRICFRK